jgi:hypothetical protein
MKKGKNMKKISQWIAIVISACIFITGTAMSIIGAMREAQPNSSGEGLALIVIGGSFMALSGLVVSFAAKLLD